MEMAIRQEGQGTGLERLMYFLQVGYFSRRIYDKFDWEAIERDLDRIMQLLEAKGLDPGMIARIRNYLDLRLEAFRRMIRQHVERELERRAYRQGEKLSREVLTDKPLFALSPPTFISISTLSFLPSFSADAFSFSASFSESMESIAEKAAAAGAALFDCRCPIKCHSSDDGA